MQTTPREMTSERPERGNRKVAFADPSSVPVIKGRRSFFTYRDLGVAEASEGTMSVQIHRAIQGMPEPSGWHYHTCDDHFIYVLKGWVVLEFETGERHHIKAGQSCYIPGGLAHNETEMSQDYEVLEVHTPGGAMKTISFDTPGKLG